MSIKASLRPLHGAFVVGEVPQQYSGNLIESLVSTVEGAGAAILAKSGTVIPLKPNARDYIRLTVLPPETEIHCSNVDCERTARVLADSRDQDVLPFCKDCAYVEFSHWMVGV